MSDKPWIDDYTYHAWARFRIPLTSIEELGMMLVPAVPEYDVCGAESQHAQRYYEMTHRFKLPHRPFYYDFEQLLAADEDKVYGVSGGLNMLAEDWKSTDGTLFHAGALVLITYNGMEAVLPILPALTYLVEVT